VVDFDVLSPSTSSNSSPSPINQSSTSDNQPPPPPLLSSSSSSSGASADNPPASPGGSINLLDFNDSSSSSYSSINALPIYPPKPPTLSSSVNLIDCNGRFTPVIFQQLWGKLPQSFAGVIGYLSRNPSSAAEIDSALRSQKVAITMLYAIYIYLYIHLSIYLSIYLFIAHPFI